SVIVENRSGAGYSIAAQSVMRGEHDGYTLLASETGFYTRRSDQTGLLRHLAAGTDPGMAKPGRSARKDSHWRPHAYVERAAFARRKIPITIRRALIPTISTCTRAASIRFIMLPRGRCNGRPTRSAVTATAIRY